MICEVGPNLRAQDLTGGGWKKEEPKERKEASKLRK